MYIHTHSEEADSLQNGSRSLPVQSFPSKGILNGGGEWRVERRGATVDRGSWMRYVQSCFTQRQPTVRENAL